MHFSTLLRKQPRRSRSSRFGLAPIGNSPYERASAPPGRERGCERIAVSRIVLMNQPPEAGISRIDANPLWTGKWGDDDEYFYVQYDGKS